MKAQVVSDRLPPIAKVVPKTIGVNTEARVDNYFWMRDRTDPDVDAYLLAENAYTAELMAHTQALQEVLYDEMLGHIKQADLSAPYPRGGYLYYSRTEEKKQYPIRCRRHGSMESPEEVLLDLNELAEGKPYLGVGTFVVSDDGTQLAYSVDETGYRQYTLFVKDLRTGRTLPEIARLTGEAVWATDNRTLLYVTEDEVSKRPDRVWTHLIGAGRELAFVEEDDIFSVGLGRTRDGEYIIIESIAKDTTEAHFLRADEPATKPRLFAAREDGVMYDLDQREGLFYVRTNEGAPDFRVFTANVFAYERSQWTELIAERPNITLTSLSLFRDFAVVSGRRDGLASLEIFNYAETTLEPLSFDEIDYVAGLGQNEEYAAAAVRITYQSLVTPPSVFDVEVATGKRTLVKRTEVPGYESDLYSAERIFATASDGMKIPISIVMRKAVARDGAAPMLLYGYGSYGISIDPTFSVARLALLDRGVIFAIAHVRGGGEYGEAWRLAGNLRNKRTTFTDFIACAENVIAQGYTTREQLVIQGGSAGGLLMGAVVNVRPELFKAAIVQVPFLDVLTTMLDASLPLTTAEYREWGNPNVKADYDYMATYSPYDNLQAKEYPAILIEASLNDSQVPYWEAAKFAAKLRSLNTGLRPVLLKTNMGAGHGGASGRYDALREIAFNWAFVLDQTAAAV